MGGGVIGQWIRERLPYCCPGLEHPYTHTHYIVRNEKRTKINKKRPALIHILPISIKKAVVVSHLLERSLPTLENHSSNPVISNFY